MDNTFITSLTIVAGSFAVIGTIARAVADVRPRAPKPDPQADPDKCDEWHRENRRDRTKLWGYGCSVIATVGGVIVALDAINGG